MTQKLLVRFTPHGLQRGRGLFNAPRSGLVVPALFVVVATFAALVLGSVTEAGAALSPETQVVGGVNNPSSAIVDTAGDLFITNSGANSIVVVPARSGTIFGQSVTANDPVKLTAATGLSYPNDLTFDAQGNLYVSNFNNGTVSVVPARSGTIFGQSVTANSAAILTAATGLVNPIGIAFDGAGNLFVSNGGHLTVVPSTTSTIFGQSFTADAASPLTAASSLHLAFGLTFDAAGDLYLATTGAISVIAAVTGTLFGVAVTVNTPTTLTSATNPTGLVTDAAGDLYYVSGGTVAVIPVNSGTSFGLAVTANQATTVLASGLIGPQDLSFDANGNLYIGNFNAQVVTVLAASTGTLFGQPVVADTSAALSVSARVNQPKGMAFDANGDLFIANYGSNDITVIAKNSGTIFGQSFTAGIPSRLTAATGLNGPSALAFDQAGDLFVSDNANSSITVIPEATGTVFGQATVADVAATLSASSGLYQPIGIAFDGHGDLFITNADNYLTVIPSAASTIFGQSVSAGQVNTLIGLTITDGTLRQPGEMAFDPQGNLFVANTANNTVSVVAAASGDLFGQAVIADTVVTLTAATGLNGPLGLAMDTAGDLFVSNYANSSISVIARNSGTLFGQPVTGDVMTTLSSFSFLAYPGGLAFDGKGDLYASDLGGVAYVTAPATLLQGGPLSVSVADSQGYSGGLTVANAVGGVTFTESNSAYSSRIIVNSSGAITYLASALPSGTYSVSGTDSDSNSPSGLGTWTFTLTVLPPVSPATGPVAPPPSDPAVPASVFGVPTSVLTSINTPTVFTEASGHTSEIITAPAGALPGGTVISIYPVTDSVPLAAMTPSGSSYVTSLAVTWRAQDGTSPVASAPIEMTVYDPRIAVGDTVYEVTSAGLQAVGTASTDGKITIAFSNDPTFLVAHEARVAQSALRVTTRIGKVGTALRLSTSGGSGSGATSFAATDGTATGCSIDGDSLTATSAGTCLVTATRAADSVYLAASSTPTAVTLTPEVTAVHPHVSRVIGSALVGASTTLKISGTGFSGRPRITSDEKGTRAVVVRDTGRLLTLRVTVRAGSRRGWFALTIHMASGSRTRVRYRVTAVHPHVSRVIGSALVGASTTLKISGTGFSGRPRITSDEKGTRAVVVRDTGRLLTLRVTVRAGSRRGWRTFTFREANGLRFRVRYLAR